MRYRACTHSLAALQLVVVSLPMMYATERLARLQIARLPQLCSLHEELRTVSHSAFSSKRYESNAGLLDRELDALLISTS
jgi:hypothetical protein